MRTSSLSYKLWGITDRMLSKVDLYKRRERTSTKTRKTSIDIHLSGGLSSEGWGSGSMLGPARPITAGERLNLSSDATCDISSPWVSGHRLMEMTLMEAHCSLRRVLLPPPRFAPAFSFATSPSSILSNSLSLSLLFCSFCACMLYIN